MLGGLPHHLRIVPAHDARGYDGIPLLVPGTH